MTDKREAEQAPDTIYLQRHSNPNDAFDWTWCRDQIHDSDVEYRRATPSPQAESGTELHGVGLAAVESHARGLRQIATLIEKGQKNAVVPTALRHAADFIEKLWNERSGTEAGVWLSEEDRSRVLAWARFVEARPAYAWAWNALDGDLAARLRTPEGGEK